MLFDDIVPNYIDRPGGYTRIIKLGQREGDGAHMAVLELVGFETAKKKKEKKAKEGDKKKKSKGKEEAHPSEEKKSKKGKMKEEVKSTEDKDDKKVKKAKEKPKDEETKDIPVIIVTGVARGERFEERMIRQAPDVPPADGYIQR